MGLQVFQTPSVFMCLLPDVPVVSFQIIHASAKADIKWIRDKLPRQDLTRL